MNSKQREQLNVLEYWRAFESFVMPTIEHKKTPVGVEQKPLILKSEADLPWPLPRNQVENKREESRFVFNVYVGLIEQSLVNDKIQEILSDNDVDYDLDPSKNLTCLAGFVLDDTGRLLEDSYITPHFITSLYTLENFDGTAKWDGCYEQAKIKFKILSENFSSQQIGVITLQKITDHIHEILNIFNCLTIEDIKFQAVVHLKKVKAPKELEEIEINEMIDKLDIDETIEEKNADESKNAEIKKDDDEETEKETSLDILPSFFLDDLTRVITTLENGTCGKALQEYLSDRANSPRKDVYRNKAIAKQLLTPSELPMANWPNPNGNTLSFAQQLAINVAVQQDNGLFSVNGPPGTGKTTLLRDVVSDVLFQRAKQLIKFEDPCDAFNKAITTNEGFKLKTTEVNKNLIGFELLVAATNNNAAENISKELPKLKDINSQSLKECDENWYFPEVAALYFGKDNKQQEDQYWGMISAVLGNKSNVYHFFDKFWNKKEKCSMKYLLERWTFHNEEFKLLVEQGIYHKEEEYIWIRDSYQDLERKTQMKWKDEKKRFQKTIIEFENLQKQYACIEKLFVEFELLDSKTDDLKGCIKKVTEDCNAITACVYQLKKAQAELKSEINTLESNLKNDRELLRLNNAFMASESAVKNARENVKNSLDELDFLKIKLYQSENSRSHIQQILDDLDQDKQDYLSIKPNKFILFICSRSKRVKDWNLNYQKIVIDSIETRENLRNIKKLNSELESQVKLKTEFNEKSSADLKDKEENYLNAKNELLQLSDGSVVISEELTQAISKYINCLSEKSQLSQDILYKLSQAEILLNEQRDSLKVLEAHYSTLAGEKDKVFGEIDIIRREHFGECEQNFPNPQFWRQGNAEIQKSSPWISEKIKAVREKLFWSAVRLHKYFIILARKPLSSNITALKRLLVNGDLPSQHHANIRSLWASLFLIVPVISSTFASIQRLFKYIGQEELAWLLIDEAGQAPVHYAAGAIWRSKRTIVVGDPLQLEPVVTLPKILSCKLREYYNVDPLYDVKTQSVQTISDISNTIGTYIGEDDNSLWVGAPLIVHRRCVEPMFSVSNQIAYDGLMIQATPPSSSPIDQFLNQSLWISLPNAYAKSPDSHWIEEEGSIACYIIGTLIKKLRKLPPIFIITPFSSVKLELLDYIKKNHLGSWKSLLAPDESKLLWKKLCKETIGTIHTFQGKQTDAVILLLGGNIRKRGAINWVASKPNMLNVAVTRAKKLLYVIGNAKHWGDQAYFSELIVHLPLVSDGKSFLKKSFEQKFEPLSNESENLYDVSELS
jgi:hypothetical protein